MTVNHARAEGQPLSKMNQLSTSRQEGGEHTPKILRARAEAEFGMLAKDNRNPGLRELVQPGGRPIAYGAAVNWYHVTTDHVPGLLTLQPRAPDYNTVPEEFVKKATDIYYMEYSFVVPIQLLDNLLDDSILGSGLGVSLAPLIQNITVIIDIHRHEQPEWRDQMVQQLRSLTKCVNAKIVRIELEGDGALDGSDLATQQTIRLVSRVVKDLYNQFDSGFSVVKVGAGNRRKEIKTYWTTPSANIKEKFSGCEVSVEQMMRAQINIWAREVL